MNCTIVRYRVAQGRAEENAELVRAVYAELSEVRPPGFRYATFVLDDGVSFVHVAVNDDVQGAPLTGLASFARFREGLAGRCDEPPAVTSSSAMVGAYRA